MSRADLTRPGPWTALFPAALSLMEHLERQTVDPVWTFGGGTVLLLRIGHRHSKDIDLFVPDPQYLGYLNPRLSDVAESLTTDYEENAEFLKLYLPAGEIDIVVGQPLTERPFDIEWYQGRAVRVETCAEIIAKKMWHRGHRAKARDLLDLCSVALAEPEAIPAAAPFMRRHGAAFLQLLHDRAPAMRADFAHIDMIGEQLSFDACWAMASHIIGPILAQPNPPEGASGPEGDLDELAP